MKLTFKAFITSWYHFLKKETWVIKAFLIFTIVIAFSVCFIINAIFGFSIPKNYLNSYSDVKKNAVCFDVISRKLYDCFVEEYKNDITLKSLYSYRENDIHYIQFLYTDDNRTIYGEPIELYLTKKEQKYIDKIYQIFYENCEVFMGPNLLFNGIYVTQESVMYYRENADNAYYWYPDDYIPEKTVKSNHTDIMVVNKKISVWFPNFYIQYKTIK